MPEKPPTLPTWSTDGGTTVEPSAGQKAAGFAVGTKPPARWVNWVLNLVFQWTQYLNAPVGTGAGAGIAATGGTTSGPGLQGTGGAPNGSGLVGTGVGTGAGVLGTGGPDANGHGVRGIAGAGANAVGVSGVGQGSGIGVHGLGGSTSGTGTYGTGGSPNGIGVRGDGAGTGIGVRGLGGPSGGAGVAGIGTAASQSGVTGVGGTSGAGVYGTGGASFGTGVRGDGVGGGGGGLFQGNAGGTGVVGIATDGYGVVAQSDTTVPAKSALRIVPQDTDPASPSAGDAYVHTTSSLLSLFFSGSIWARVKGSIKGMTAAEVSAATTALTQFTTKASFSGARLRVGTQVRIRAIGRDGTSTGLATLGLMFGRSGFEQVVVATANRLIDGTSPRVWLMEATITIRTIGAAGDFVSHGMTFDAVSGAAPTIVSTVLQGVADNLLGTIVAAAFYDLSNAAGSVQLDQFSCEIVDP